jgi:hypothetical protein
MDSDKLFIRTNVLFVLDGTFLIIVIHANRMPNMRVNIFNLVSPILQFFLVDMFYRPERYEVSSLVILIIIYVTGFLKTSP